MPRDRSPASHTDIEDLAKKLDRMIDAGREVGIHYFHVEQAAEQLRYLSNLLHGTQKLLDEAIKERDAE